jgi:hypothetical protein
MHFYIYDATNHKWLADDGRDWTADFYCAYACRELPDAVSLLDRLTDMPNQNGALYVMQWADTE